MTLSEQQRQQIDDTIKECIRKKLRTYNPETKQMPFHYRLLGKDRMALFSFIHSLNTTIGTSIFEPVAVIVAQTNFPVVKRQYTIGNQISEAHRLKFNI